MILNNKYHTYEKNFTAAVGVPKSLLKNFERNCYLNANFLVTNSITLSEKDISIFLSNLSYSFPGNLF